MNSSTPSIAAKYNKGDFMAWVGALRDLGQVEASHAGGMISLNLTLSASQRFIVGEAAGRAFIGLQSADAMAFSALQWERFSISIAGGLGAGLALYSVAFATGLRCRLHLPIGLRALHEFKIMDRTELDLRSIDAAEGGGAIARLGDPPLFKVRRVPVSHAIHGDGAGLTRPGSL